MQKDNQQTPTPAESLRQKLQLCIAETIKLLEEGKIREALVVLHVADKALEEHGHLLSENKQQFFNTNLGRFHDAARFLANTKTILPLNNQLHITKEDLLEDSYEISSESDSSEEQDNNNNTASNQCIIL